MKKLMLIPVVAIVAIFGSPFASAAMAAEKPAAAAEICFDEAGHKAHGVCTKAQHICLQEKRGEICEHTEM